MTSRIVSWTFLTGITGGVDRNAAITKFTDLLPRCLDTEFVLIAMPHTATLFRTNPALEISSVAPGRLGWAGMVHFLKIEPIRSLVKVILMIS